MTVRAARAAEALVRALPRTTLVVGKGGVGKTTCAAALALHASRDHRTLLLSTDPAKALPSVLATAVGAEPTAIAASPKLFAQLLDADALRTRFLARWGDVIRAILDRGTYLDDSDIGPLVDTALPGGDEIFSALALAELMVQRDSQYELVVVDTAPTGHTLRLLNLPRTFRALVRLLDAMQEKHRFMVRTLTRTYRSDAADAFLTEMTALVNALDDSLHDASRCGAVMVTNPQPLVLDESRRYATALADLHVNIAAVVWNATDVPGDLSVDAPQFLVPRLDVWPVGGEGLERWLTSVTVWESGVGRMPNPGPRSLSDGSRRLTPNAQPATPNAQRPAHNAQLTTLLRPLTVVAGKGGVGKTSVACALALVAADNGRTLIVSTDPAPSLADAFAQEIGDADVPVRDVANLAARQMDASAAFSRMRSEYQTRVDALFESLMGRGLELAHDRAIARDLLSLAPPGVDEVYALSLIADALFGGQYDCVVVDPAPTGHLLRMLEMPQLALAWTHQIMRLMLKYKDVAGLGDTARELLDFAHRLRALDALLQDGTRCGVVLVMLDEPVVRDESDRLARALVERHIALTGVVCNRVSDRSPLPVADAPVHLEAPAVQPPPVGTPALRAWAHSWRSSDNA